MSFTHYSAKDRDDLRPISKTDAIVYPEALRKFVAEKLDGAKTLIPNLQD